MPSYRSAPHIAVVGPNDATESLCRLAFAVGEMIADRGGVVVCGGRSGVMEAAARGAHAASPPGLTIGILPGADRNDGNQFLDIVIATGLHEYRDGVVVSTSDAVIAIGGNAGTHIETGFALLHKRPLVVLSGWSIREKNKLVSGVTYAVSAAQAVQAAFLGLGL